MGLFGWLLGRKGDGRIHVKFYDAETQQLFAESHVPLAQLPESFDNQTNMHLLDADWAVVDARPANASEFARSGTLTLILQKIVIQTVDPAGLLYSLPTLCDPLPEVLPGSSKRGNAVLEIHEDDWRQIEWISASHASTIEAELERVRQIYQDHREGYGFRQLHLRQAITAPLEPLHLQVDALHSMLGQRAALLEGFAYHGQAGIVRDSFALRLLSSVELYGIAPGGEMRSICFTSTRTNNVPQPDVGNLARFAAAHDLLLVNWCRAEIVSAAEDQYAEFFAPASQ